MWFLFFRSLVILGAAVWGVGCHAQSAVLNTYAIHAALTSPGCTGVTVLSPEAGAPACEDTEESEFNGFCTGRQNRFHQQAKGINAAISIATTPESETKPFPLPPLDPLRFSEMFRWKDLASFRNEICGEGRLRYVEGSVAAIWPKKQMYRLDLCGPTINAKEIPGIEAEYVLLYGKPYDRKRKIPRDFIKVPISIIHRTSGEVLVEDTLFFYGGLSGNGKGNCPNSQKQILDMMLYAFGKQPPGLRSDAER